MKVASAFPEHAHREAARAAGWSTDDTALMADIRRDLALSQGQFSSVAEWSPERRVVDDIGRVYVHRARLPSSWTDPAAIADRIAAHAGSLDTQLLDELRAARPNLDEVSLKRILEDMLPTEQIVTEMRRNLHFNAVQSIRKAARKGHLIHIRLRHRMRAPDGNIRLSYTYCPVGVLRSTDPAVMHAWLRGDLLPGIWSGIAEEGK